MIESIRQLGVYKREQEGLDLVGVLTDSAKISNVDKVLILHFKIDQGQATFEKVGLEDYDPSKATLFLYRYGSSRGTDITPTSKITDIEKTFPNKIINWFKKVKGSGKFSLAIKKFFEDSSEEDLQELTSLLEEEHSKLDSSEQHLLSVKINTDGQVKYLGELEEFQEKLKDKARRRFSYHSSKGESLGEGTCYLCGRHQELLGFAFPLAFYNVDQPGFVYNFAQENSWKQLPLCLDCALEIDLGTQYLNERLSFNFYGFKYYFIPKFFFENLQGEILEDIEDLFTSKKRRYEEGPLLEEENWQEILLERGDVLSLVFLFFEKSLSRIIIRQFVADVAPSWLKTLFDTFNQEITVKTIFREESLKKTFGGKVTGNFKDYSASKGQPAEWWGFIKEFFPSSKTKGIYDKYFLDIVGQILSKTKINEGILIRAFVRKMREIYREEKGKWKNFATTTLRSLLLLSMFKELDLLRNGVNNMSDKILESFEFENEQATRVKDFFEQHPQALDRPEKKGIFLQGVLTRFLLAVQYQNLKSQPFQSKLYGLQLDQRKLKKLLPQTVEKLREYNISYSWLEELIARYMLLADEEGWSITNYEISYYFMLGLTLGQTFKGEKKE
ncbi:MAG: TIGR02556 family CRISPR-associated protein [Candidatus Heimdallarchaeota archaeon]|nr:TIGR02556 family CRISPR-associated protein [Candidatus Heimdallarchaeota archaeon]